MSALQTLRAIAADPDAVAREWVDAGRKVVGVRCLYAPEEILWAAGLLPYPLYGTPEPVKLADSYFQSCTCELVRNLYDHALQGRFDGLLSGLALSNTCDVVRRLWDIWGQYTPQIPVHMVNNPQKLLDETNRAFFLRELRDFQAWAEGIAGAPVTDEALAAAIALYDETRGLLRELYELRNTDPTPLTADEALDVLKAVTVLPKDRANGLLRELLAELRERALPERDGPRILVTGSLLDDGALVRMIEEEGGVVAVEDLCNTTRWFWHRIHEGEPGDASPLEALYAWLNRRPLCACLHPPGAREEFVKELVEQFDVDAVVDFNLKYCHPFLYEAPLLKQTLQAIHVPMTVLEVGHDHSGHGQLRTRIQAFIEMLD